MQIDSETGSRRSLVAEMKAKNLPAVEWPSRDDNKAGNSIAYLDPPHKKFGARIDRRYSTPDLGNPSYLGRLIHFSTSTKIP